jgi:hypothetical protein
MKLVDGRNIPLLLSGELDNHYYDALLPEQKRGYVFFKKSVLHKQPLQETIPLVRTTAYFYFLMFSILV